jgi:phospholipid N-methyltransferase
MPSQRGTTGPAALEFLRHFVRDPGLTGSLVPSSRFLMKRMLRPVDWDRARVIVELGPGLGGFTKEMLHRMHRDAALIAFEMNQDFVESLREALPDRRLIVLHASAADAIAELQRLGYDGADAIISSLPFANMPDAVRLTILNQVHRLLRPQAKFVLYQYRLVLLPLLQSIFPSIERDFEPINIPPAHVFICQK